MKVLVTGGSGIVGHYVIDELYKNGHTVINADVARMSTNLGHSGTIGTASGEAAVKMRENWPGLPKFFEVEIANYGQVISALDGCDAVISLASRPSAANYTEEDVKEVARAFTSFYDRCPVLGAEGPVRANRLALCLLSAETLAHGLDLLGITALDAM